MTRIRSVAAGALVVGLLAGTAAYAQAPGPGGQGRRQAGPGGAGLPIRALNLTEAQQQQIGDIRERHQADVQKAAQRLRAALTAQRKAADTIPANEALIRSTTQELAEAQADVAVAQARVQTEIWPVLTPEQQRQVKELQAARDSRTPRTRPEPAARPRARAARPQA